MKRNRSNKQKRYKVYLSNALNWVGTKNHEKAENISIRLGLKQFLDSNRQQIIDKIRRESI